MKNIKALGILLVLVCTASLLLTGCKVKSGHLPTQQHPNPELVESEDSSTTEETTKEDSTSSNSTDSTNSSDVDPTVDNPEDVSKIDTTQDTDAELFIPDSSETSLDQEIQFDSRFLMENIDWSKPAFVWEDITYTVPFSYARISNNWTFNYKDYGLESDYILAPHTKTTMDFTLTSEIYDFQLLVGFSNPYDVDITLDQADVWAISMDIKDATVNPFVMLPQNITWNTSLVDLITPYGMPTKDISYDEKTRNFTLTYNMNYETYLELIVNQTTGLTKFTYMNYDLDEQVGTPSGSLNNSDDHTDTDSSLPAPTSDDSGN